MLDLIISEIQESIEVKKNFLSFAPTLKNALEILEETLFNSGKILVCGNGGSAADAQHFVAELVGKYKDEKRKGLPAIALTTNTSNITAIANDIGFEEIFSRQVEALGKKGDVLIAISTSGKSENVNRACLKAKDLGIKVIYLTGSEDPPVHKFCDVVIKVPSNSTPRIQEVHGLVLHIFAYLIERKILESKTQ
ncbi:MAG: SIS domain-containing protein [Candidatus Hydrothermales bacterium]